MKTPDTTTNPFAVHGSFLKPGSNVVFIAKNNSNSISAITLASACEMYGLPSICASYGGGSGQFIGALGAKNVINLPIWSINPKSCHLAAPIQRAREENSVLIIDAMVTTSFEFKQLTDALNLLRGDTLSIVLSLLGSADTVPNMESAWDCRPDHCVVHIIGTEPDHHGTEIPASPWEQLSWYSGNITDGMIEVLERSGPYESLPAIPQLPGIFHVMPEGSWIRQDHHIQAVVEMLASAQEDTRKCIFGAFVGEMI